MKKRTQHLFSAMVFVGFIFIAFGSGDDNKSTEESINTEIQKSPAIEINASQLYSEYEANGVLAGKNYKYKILKVTGIINSFDKDIMDNIYVTLKGDKYVGDVQCFFSEDYIIDSASSLLKGQKITVTGKCDGKMMNVMLKCCAIN